MNSLLDIMLADQLCAPNGSSDHGRAGSTARWEL